ncbi:MAG TPA: aldehyde dehydrogenase family protein [Polyangiaceae bacterium]
MLGDLFVDGACVAGATKRARHAPWDGAPLGEVSEASLEDAACATEASVRAFEALRATPTRIRREALRDVARKLEAELEPMAKLLAEEAGKPIAFARAEVARAVATFELAAEESTRLGGEVLDLDATKAGEGMTGFVRRVPSGPVLAISPFNFPLNLVAHKVAPALACGCSVVLKPAPQTPRIALRLAELVRETELPKAALQVLPCHVPVAESLVKDDRYATLSFTGSDRVGWHLKSFAGKKRVLLELGGNAAAIVHEDADQAFALERIVSGAFGYAGQVCIKVQRLYVQDTIFDGFVAQLVERTKALAVRAPGEDGILSCMIDAANAERVEGWIDESIAADARVLCRGLRKGNRLGPSILAIDGSGRGQRLVDDEAFGPVLTVHRYASWDEALALADGSRFGLQAGIFTDSEKRIASAFERLHVGGLIVGDVPTFRVDGMPYGGTRDSGLGREGVRYAIEEMTERKLLVRRRTH